MAEITQEMIRASTRWLLDMQRAAGTDMGMKCYDVMRASFGEELAGGVLFGLMTQSTSDFTIRWQSNELVNKIQCIKALRTLTGLGLGEAKAAVEGCVFNSKTYPITKEFSFEEREQLFEDMRNGGLHVR